MNVHLSTEYFPLIFSSMAESKHYPRFMCIYQVITKLSTYILKSVPSYCFHRFLMIFNKITHTCERNTVEIVKRKYLQDILIEQLSLSTQKNSQERKQIPYGDL